MNIKLRFGAMSPLLSEQLNEYGLTAKLSDVAKWQRLSDSINMLHLHSICNDSAASKHRSKLMKEIVKGVWEKEK